MLFSFPDQQLCGIVRVPVHIAGVGKLIVVVGDMGFVAAVIDDDYDIVDALSWSENSHDSQS